MVLRLSSAHASELGAMISALCGKVMNMKVAEVIPALRPIKANLLYGT